jgi:hypothetical protein
VAKTTGPESAQANRSATGGNLLVRGLRVMRSGTLALGGRERSGSDHKLVWADSSPAGRS